MEAVLNYLNTTTLSFLSLIFFFFLHRLSKFARDKEAPRVARAWPILGHLPLLSTSQTPHKTLGELADKYGSLFTIMLGSKRALVISNWEMAKECYTKNDVVVSTRPKLLAAELMSYNQAFIGLAPYGPYWRELRKTVTFEFFHNRRNDISNTRVSEVQTSVKELHGVWLNKNHVSSHVGAITASTNSNLTCNNRITEYVLVEMKEWFSRLTLNLVLRMVVGKRYFGMGDVALDEKAERCMKNIREFMRLMGTFTVADGVPWLRWMDLGGYEKDMKETAKEFDKMLSEWLEEHKEKKGLGEEDVVKGPDFMDVMLSVLNERHVGGFDADTICKAITLELILGGTDSTSVTLTWAMTLLLRNPHTLEKAREEIDTHIGKDKHITESDITKLVYLQAIVKETLRLYPPAPLSTPREFTEDCTVSGYHVKKGTRLIPNLWKIHRDPSVWPDPLEFKPERFLTTHKDVDVKGHHFELLPFGGGRRICAGMSIGLQMVHFTLANFLHSFEILNPSNEPVDLKEIFGFTNTKATPLEILVKPRLSPHYYETI